MYRWILKFSDNVKIKIRSSNNLLSVILINLALLLLHKQFPNIIGLEETELDLRKKFTVQKGKFLQTSHDRNH